MITRASAPATIGQVRERIERARSEVERLGVRRLALFGSLLDGRSHPESDVDLLVEFQPGQKSFDRFLALAELLERLLNRPVELVTPEALSPYLGPHILAEATEVLRAA